MEEELNEHDLEERLYAMLHHVDGTQNNVNQTANQVDTTALVENNHRPTLRRYWRTSTENNPHVKTNTPNPNVRTNHTFPNNKANTLNPNVKVNTSTTSTYVRIIPTKPTTPLSNSKPDDAVPKEEKSSSPVQASVDLSIFQSPIPENAKKVIEIIEHDDNHKVVLESSDEDEVVEVALPPKPTITIESSDEDELEIVKQNTPTKTVSKPATTIERGISTSPVPSVVSSVSDDFIRGDCIALNISSRPNNPSFDFSLHGPDLVVQNTPAKKKKRKRNKSTATSTPIASVENSISQPEECFATPKGKAKNKKKAKSNISASKSVPNPDIYDSDSNQSIIDITKSKNTYAVTEKSLPSADVYESDSGQSEIVKENTAPKQVEVPSSDSSLDKEPENGDSELYKTCETVVDLTDDGSFFTVDNTGITESIVLSNVTGFTESDDYGDYRSMHDTNDVSKFVSSKIPQILNADLDFDNLKGNERVCKKRRYSVTSLRAEMEKFYNESWGGEDFNHREIQKNMSRDKDLWAIDVKDRIPASGHRKTKCNYCNRHGHRDDMCMRKPAICYMCGNNGHFESRCPSKICINCGTRNNVYTNICRNCASWRNVKCAECGQAGHPSSHCPDIWRRYHNTTEITMNLEKCTQTKHRDQLYCSGCSCRGHLIHSCRSTIPFAAFAINSPYVCVYNPIYFPPKNQPTNKHFSNVTISQDPAQQNRCAKNKRLSKSPTSHESHVNKKRNTSTGDDDKRRYTKSPVNIMQQTKAVVDTDKNKEVTKNIPDSSAITASEKALDFIPIGSANRDNMGHIIQDNEVSDTSDVVTSARIYLKNEVIDKLKTKEGQEWLQEITNRLKITVQFCQGMNSYLSVKGIVGDQETFQRSLREREKIQNSAEESNVEVADSQKTEVDLAVNLPKNRNSLLRELNKALESLKSDLGDPKSIFRELNYTQNNHTKLLKQKVISPTVLSNSRCKINKAHKRLNTVLLGQAGLANGSNSVRELISYKERLSNYRNPIVPLPLRQEIGQHFHSIFTSSPRNDYKELLNEYYQSNPKVNKKKNKGKSKATNPRMKKIKSIPSQQDSPETNTPLQTATNNTNKNVPANLHMKKLVILKKRLEKAKPKQPVLKKTRMDLIRKLHVHICSMFQRETLTSKVLKKVKKAQQEAQHFFSANV